MLLTEDLYAGSVFHAVNAGVGFGLLRVLGPGERRAVAEEFIEWAPKFCDAPAVYLITRHWHVRVGQQPEYCATRQKYDVQLTFYTLFGLPIGQLSQPACERLRCLSPFEQWE